MIVETNVYVTSAPLTIIADDQEWRRIHVALRASDDASIVELRSMIAAKILHGPKLMRVKG